MGTREERDEIKAGNAPKLISEAEARGLSPLQALVRRINFQHFTTCRKAYLLGYGLQLGNVAGSSEIQRVRRLVRYRHRVVHVSPLLELLNQLDVPPEEPEFSNTAFAEAAASTFDEFISRLHTATLALRP